MNTTEPKSSKKQRRLRRFFTGLTGGVVLLVGVVAIPYPGPGWLIVFTGLAILAKEFAWAQRALLFGRKKYDEWNVWIAQQSWWVKALTFIFTSVVVVVTIWLLNGYGLLNNWFNLSSDWLQSPLIK
jgi:uncharacterized protein (TIGR02611 family)